MKINEQQFEDVLTEITHMKCPKTLRMCQTTFLRHKKTTIATIVYHDDSGNIVIKQGFANRKKGDNNNQVVGDLLSLMRAKTMK